MAENTIDLLTKALESYKASVANSKKIPKWKKEEINSGISITRDMLDKAEEELAATTPPKADELFSEVQDALKFGNTKPIDFNSLGLPGKMSAQLSDLAKLKKYYVIEPEDGEKITNFLGKQYSETGEIQMNQYNPITPRRIFLATDPEFDAFAEVEGVKKKVWFVQLKEHDLANFMKASKLL